MKKEQFLVPALGQRDSLRELNKKYQMRKKYMYLVLWSETFISEIKWHRYSAKAHARMLKLTGAGDNSKKGQQVNVASTVPVLSACPKEFDITCFFFFLPNTSQATYLLHLLKYFIASPSIAHNTAKQNMRARIGSHTCMCSHVCYCMCSCVKGDQLQIIDVCV